MIRSAPRWRMSSITEPLMPRPSSISLCSERETTSREASSSAIVVDQELPGEELLVARDLAPAHLLVQDLDQDVAGDVGREDRAGRACGAERPLRELPVLLPREERAPVLELDDVAGRLACEDL